MGLVYHSNLASFWGAKAPPEAIHVFRDSALAKYAPGDPQGAKKIVGETAKFLGKIENLVVVHDDLDIPLGSFKIQFGRGPKDHNGILDIEEKLGTKDFWRVRIGIDNRPLDNKPMGEIYTLEDF